MRGSQSCTFFLPPSLLVMLPEVSTRFNRKKSIKCPHDGDGELIEREWSITEHNLTSWAITISD